VGLAVRRCPQALKEQTRAFFFVERLGVFLESLSLEDTFRFAKLADENGFDSIWLPEITWSDSFSLATAAAMNTKRVKLATGVVGIFGRSPVLMAMSVAGLDDLSGGRAILGLGSQAKPYVELWHGTKFDRPIERMREYVKAVKIILANPFKLTSYSGEIIKVGAFVLTVKPRGMIPVYVAAIGPRMQRVAGEVGDGVVGYFYSVRYVKDVLMPNLKEGAEREGRDLKDGPFDVAVGLPTLVSDSEDRFEMVKPLVAVFTVAKGSSPSYQAILGDLGFSGNVGLVSKKVKEGDIEGAVKHIPDEMAREVTLCGNTKEIRQRIQEYRQAGVNLPLMNPTPPYAYYPLFPTHLPDKLGAGSVDYAGLREQVYATVGFDWQD
jgi:alkanesulfonate monooxygenase SsuD/methylene tetrahydromethanopterin reductase-like flavin-dependent oxidoreductase (luciferase family)